MRWYRLKYFVFACVLVWLTILAIAWFIFPADFMGTLWLATFFFIGMLAMFLAQHIYPFHPW